MLVLFRRALKSGVLRLGIGLVDLVESTPAFEETQAPELSKTLFISSRIWSASFIFFTFINSIVFSMRSDAWVSQVEFCTRTLACCRRDLGFASCGDAPVEWDGEWAGAGERLTIGVGYAYVFVVASIDMSTSYPTCFYMSAWFASPTKFNY